MRPVGAGDGWLAPQAAATEVLPRTQEGLAIDLNRSPDKPGFVSALCQRWRASLADCARPYVMVLIGPCHRPIYLVLFASDAPMPLLPCQCLLLCMQLDTSDAAGTTPLHLATDAPAAAVLLTAGAPVDSVDNAGAFGARWCS